MNTYRKYNYFWGVENNKKYIVKGAGMKKYLNQGLNYIGSWYAHEKTPYIFENKVVRDRYGKQVILTK